MIESCDKAKHDCFLSGFGERSTWRPELMSFAYAGESSIVWKTCTFCTGQYASVKNFGRHERECRGADSAGTIISDTFLFGPALAYVWGNNFVLIADECALPDCNPARYCDWL